MGRLASFARHTVRLPLALLLAIVSSLVLIGGIFLAMGQSAGPARVPVDLGQAAVADALTPGLSSAAAQNNRTATTGSSPESVAGSSAAPGEQGSGFPASATPVPTASLPSPTPTPTDHRFSVLLLGYGGDGHDGAYLTDAMMVVIVDPDQKTLTFLSLPRDLWVPLSFDGVTSYYNKINTAYAFARDSHLYPNRLTRYRGTAGAGDFAKDTVASVLGIRIDYYLALDFQGFRELIDAVGGVDVAVPNSFTAQYPRNDNPSLDPGWTIVRFRAGTEHMSGERALQFARAREVLDNASEGNDFARANRQRILLTSLKAKLLQPGGLIHLPQMLDIFRRYADTDYPLLSLGDVAGLVLSWSDVRFYQASLSLSNYLTESVGPAGEYILVPRGVKGSWEGIRALARQLWMNPSLGQAMAMTEVDIVNRTGSIGLASRAAGLLSSLGYALGATEAGTPQERTAIYDQSEGKAQPLLGALIHDLGLASPEVVTEEPSELESAPRVVVELGRDALELADGTPPLQAVPIVPATPTPAAVGTLR